VRDAGTVFVHPYDATPVPLDQGESPPELMQDQRLLGIVAVQGQGASKAGVLATPIGSQVDDAG
jgi:hypothetical protein